MDAKPWAKKPPEALQKDRRSKPVTPAELKILGMPERRSGIDREYKRLFADYKKRRGTELGKKILAATERKTLKLHWLTIFTTLNEALELENPPHRDSIKVLLKSFAKKSGALSLGLLLEFLIKERIRTLHKFFKAAIKTRLAKKGARLNLKALAYLYATTLFMEQSITSKSKDDPRSEFLREMTETATAAETPK